MKKFLWQYVVILCVVMFFSIVFVAKAQEKHQNGMNLQNFPYTEYTHPLIIDVMKHIAYPGSEIIIEEELPHGKNYNRYVASYISDGKKVYSLLAVPHSKKSSTGSPAIVMAHGYVPPKEYSTGSLYTELVDGLARNGYVIFMPDFRGHGKSEGEAEGAYFSAGYTQDFLNAVSSIKRYKGVDSTNIGVWGHSMGGNILLRSITVNPEIKSASMWSGVVGSYNDLLFHWNDSTVWKTSDNKEVVRPETLEKQFGSINENQKFWNKISPTAYLKNIKIPVQLHHAVKDPVVPVEFSKKLSSQLEEYTYVELYEYQGDDHDLSEKGLYPAVDNTVQFFDKTLK